MAMGNLFKSKKEREKDTRRERRHAFRKAENAVEDVKDRVRDMERNAKKQWDQARESMKSGQKAAAQRQLIGYRAAQVLMTKLEQKRWVFEQYLAKMQAAQSDGDFASALGALNKVVQIDPERVQDVFEDAQDLLGEQVDADRFWGKLYEKEMEGAQGSLEDYIPSVDELSEQLESEAASEVGGGAESVGRDLDSRLGAARERVNQLLEKKSS